MMAVALVAQPFYGAIASQVAHATSGDAAVTIDNPKGWHFTTTGDAEGEYAKGPAYPSSGNGSYKLISLSGKKGYLYDSSYGSDKLSSLSKISYSYLVTSRSSGTSVAPSLSLFTTIHGQWTELKVEPTYTDGAPANSWQTVNAFDASTKWYSTKDLKDNAGNTVVHKFNGVADLVSWQTLVGLDANAALNKDDGATGVRLTFGQNSGGAPWSNFVAYVDNVNINGNNYDFEPTLNPTVTATNFNTSKDAGYNGINVGFALNDDFQNVSAVKVDLYQGGSPLATNTGNDKLLQLIHGGEKTLSTPFIVVPGNYTEEYWNRGEHEWLRAEKPTRAVVTVTDENGDHLVTNSNLVEPNGWTYESLFNHYTYSASDSKFVSDSRTNPENNSKSGGPASIVNVPKETTNVRFTFTGPTTVKDVPGKEHTQKDQWPNKNGEHQYRIEQALPAGDYVVTAQYKTNDGTGTWYDVTGSQQLQVLVNPTAEYVTPNDGQVFRASDNPSQIRSSDGGKFFTKVVFTIDNVKYEVPRSKCDLRAEGKYVICQVYKASNWPTAGLSTGAHTINSVIAYNAANGNVTLPARQFIVDAEGPEILSAKITTPASAPYSKQVSVTVKAQDNIGLASVTGYVVQKEAGRCDPNGIQLLSKTVDASGRSDEVTVPFETQGLNGDYCFFFSAKDQATHSSNPNVGSAKFEASFDTAPPTGSVIYDGGNKAGALIYLKSANDLKFTGTFHDNIDLARATYVVWKLDSNGKRTTDFCGNWNVSSVANYNLNGSTDDSYSALLTSCGADASWWTNGSYEIGHAVYDAAGNKTNLNTPTQKFVIDNINPIVSFNVPASGTTISGKKVKVRASIKDDNFGECELNVYKTGETTNPIFTHICGKTDSFKTQTVATVDTMNGLFPTGQYDFVLTATDKAGNSTSATHTVIVNNTVPAVTAGDFATWDNSANGFKAINVGFGATDFSKITGITVDLYNNDGKFATHTASPAFLGMINDGTVSPASLSTPFVTSGTLNDTYCGGATCWNDSGYVWAADSKMPLKAIVTVSGQDARGADASKATELTPLSDSPASFASVLPEVTTIDIPVVKGGQKTVHPAGQNANSGRRNLVASAFGGFASAVTVGNGASTTPNSQDATDNDTAVLGTQDKAGTPLTDTAAVTTNDGKGTILGLMWFWWLAILAAAVVAWLLIAAAVRRARGADA